MSTAAHSIGTRHTLEPLAVVAGVRTPFVKSFGALNHVPAAELGRVAVEALLKKTGLPVDNVEEVIFGNVASPADASNVARVISLKAGIPADRVAHTVNRNCASGMEAVVTAWQTIHEGRSDIIIAGGTESMSNVPLLWHHRVRDLLLDLGKEKKWWKKPALLARFRPRHFKPIPALQVGLTDPTCGLNMGQTGEILAREFTVTRDEQDRFALASHQRAVAAWERCFFSGEVVPVCNDQTKNIAVEKDTGPRPGQTFEALARLRPVFEPKGGTITVGNSCPITDGAAALMLMPVSRAKELNYEPLGYLRGYAVAGCDPRRMGLGPVFATNKLLNKTGLSLSDFDLFEINEAFAAQVLACVKAFVSADFAKEQLHRDTPLGEIDLEKLNVNGGAIALGHPVGTSGARLILTLLRALHEKKLRRGLAALCIGGGQGEAVWVETELGE